MRRYQPRAASAILAVLLVAGCGPFRGSAPEPFAVVVVENDTPRAATVYALRDGLRMRVGRVASVGTQILALRPDMLGPGGQLQLAVMAMGSTRLHAGTPLAVERGDTVYLTVGGLIR
jgi:hypothetical protein